MPTNTRPRRWLAARTIIAASPGHLNPPDWSPAPITGLAFTRVSAMPPLIFARLSRRVHKVRYRGTSQQNRAFQDFPQRAAQAFRLTTRELRATPRRVNLCPPQTFIGIDVSYSAQNVLIEQQSFDPRAPRADLLRELLFGHLEWIGAKRPQLFPQRSTRSVRRGVRATNQDAARADQSFVARSARSARSRKHLCR